RRRGWAEVVLRKGGPASWSFHPAYLGRDLRTVPQATARRRQEWDALCRRLGAADHAAEYRAELPRADARHRRLFTSRSLPRWIELKLHQRGLIPRASEAS